MQRGGVREQKGRKEKGSLEGVCKKMVERESVRRRKKVGWRESKDGKGED